MKKILLTPVIFGVLIADASGKVPNSMFNGFYAGAGLTYSRGEINNKNSILAEMGTIGASSKGTGINSFLGFRIPAFDGDFHLGSEVRLGYDGSRFNNKNVGTGGFSGMKYNSSSSLTCSIVVHLGHAFSNVLPYLTLGFERRSDATLKDSNGDAVLLINGRRLEIVRNGSILGAGIDYAITKNIFIRGDYTHNFGSRNKYTYKNIEILDFHTSTDTFLVGVGYKF